MAYCTSVASSFAYSQLLLLMIFIPIHNLLVCLRKSISTLFLLLGLSHFIEPDIPYRHVTEAGVSSSSSPTAPYYDVPLLVHLFGEILPVVKFCDLVDPPGSCVVCFYDFEGEDEIRRLANCRHVFHRSCLDRWMGDDNKTCPLCRRSFIPHDMQDTYNESLWYWSATGKH
ncbi:Detected protein of unknown function [Hibiscus syriacus]|uniref:RING-type domain-containing protein n=1 Tax=Hibiscus syriacus TaxID=106335 RepID=A0A6A2ZQX9_HIBSY|nr:probable E3 ubiquitin-protein ligase RHA1A [Hibiscus syriacus]KAE8694324.1 Detected protein of unknown function [Hibiscus syriacus]